MSQKSIILCILASLILFCCNTETDDTNTTKINPTSDPIVFIVAGQSNALGSIKLSVVEELKNGIPLGQEELTEEERLQARLAVAKL